jgi:hypothetical protein
LDAYGYNQSMLCRLRSAALGLAVLCACAEPLSAAHISVEKCGTDAVRVEADHIAPHENPATEMSRSAMFACPSGFGILQAQTIGGGKSIVWSVRCNVWDKPSSTAPAPC